MTPHANRLQQAIRDRVLEVMNTESAFECAKGFLRYETLRKLNIPELTDLHRRNLHGERFDDMVDELITGLNRTDA